MKHPALVIPFVLALTLLVSSIALVMESPDSSAEAQSPASANQAHKLMEYERRKAEALEKQADALKDIDRTLGQIERRCRTR